MQLAVTVEQLGEQCASATLDLGDDDERFTHGDEKTVPLITCQGSSGSEIARFARRRNVRWYGVLPVPAPAIRTGPRSEISRAIAQEGP
jgi:hypothetical protein